MVRRRRTNIRQPSHLSNHSTTTPPPHLLPTIISSGSIWYHLGSSWIAWISSGIILDHLGSSGLIWHQLGLGSSESSWEHLGSSGSETSRKPVHFFQNHGLVRWGWEGGG